VDKELAQIYNLKYLKIFGSQRHGSSIWMAINYVNLSIDSYVYGYHYHQTFKDVAKYMYIGINACPCTFCGPV